MSNYTTENLTPAIPIPGVPAIRIGDQVFTMAAGGTDVSDTTATSATVLSGYDFYNASGVKTTGTIQTVTASQSGNIVTVPAGYIATSQTITVGTAKAAATYTPTTSDQTITAGQYLTGDQTIKGDANLLASNIISGVTIFGVTGTASSGATDYYKCATVDTVNQTWTGYKAVLADGVYSFEATATSGLTYSVVTPEVGKVYADGALVKTELYTGIPLNGLVFYAPLERDAATAETGQMLTKAGSGISYQTYNGIPCARFAQRSYIQVTAGLSELPSGSSPFTISAWCCLLNTAESYGSFAFGYGNASSFNEAGFWFEGTWSEHSDTIAIDFHNNKGFATGATYVTGTWYHCCVVWDGNLLRSYVNGTARNTASKTVNMGTSMITIGIRGENTPNYEWDGYIAGCRIYNRALSAAEIAALAAEFTPSAQ